MWARKDSNFRAYDLQSLPTALVTDPNKEESSGPDPHTRRHRQLSRLLLRRVGLLSIMSTIIDKRAIFVKHTLH